MDVQFEWDEAKARSNNEKHRITFLEATTVFADPFLLTFFDDVYSDDEDRLISIGASDQRRLLLVIHTERDGRLRIISARRATRNEQKAYEQRPK